MFVTLSSKEGDAVLAAMTNVYWLACEELPTLKLNYLVLHLECHALKDLNIGKNAQYAHHSITEEMQGAVSNFELHFDIAY